MAVLARLEPLLGQQQASARRHDPTALGEPESTFHPVVHRAQGPHHRGGAVPQRQMLRVPVHEDGAVRAAEPTDRPGEPQCGRARVDTGRRCAVPDRCPVPRRRARSRLPRHGRRERARRARRSAARRGRGRPSWTPRRRSRPWRPLRLGAGTPCRPPLPRLVGPPIGRHRVIVFPLPAASAAPFAEWQAARSPYWRGMVSSSRPVTMAPRKPASTWKASPVT